MEVGRKFYKVSRNIKLTLPPIIDRDCTIGMSGNIYIFLKITAIPVSVA
jgi:hypothetical protein